MIQITRPVPTDAAWLNWKARATQATLDLVALAQTKKINSTHDIDRALYSENKRRLFDAFHGKCAYCEARTLDYNQHGEVEHYRPKGPVTDDPNSPTHPGYYWLAYEWDNLVPSCISCNQLHICHDHATRGKGNRFPITGPRAYDATQSLTAEEPLLLNPLVDDPTLHLKLEPGTGILAHRSTRGRLTIDLLDLNREGLMSERVVIYRAVLALCSQRLAEKISGIRSGVPPPPEVEIESYRNGTAPFSFVGRLAIAAVEKELYL